MASGMGNRGKGRPKGSKNKNTAAIKDMVLEALNGAGGAKYLQRQADENPSAFMSLLGRVLPLQVAGDPENPLNVVTKIVLTGPKDAA